MSENKFIKSEQGTKAAWKGFSSQTTYIAHRIMSSDGDSEFFPEKVEDLLVQKNAIPTELVQVKNLASDLYLSNLAPKEEDSFFKRCLAYKEQNPNLTLRVVSFGNIGQELQGVIRAQENSCNSIISKLLEYGYSRSDASWILTHLSIDKVNEEDLLSEIYEQLESTIESMVAPHVILDILCYYVSQLSRTGGYITKEIWQAKLQNIGLDLSSLSGVARQYGNTIIPLYEYGGNDSLEVLQKEYLEGINASPQHIRFGLDVERTFWLNKISEAFNNYNIVIIRGASGQGKSSLAYRFLLNNYSESDVICIEKITSEEQAIDIRSALSGIAKNRTNPIIAYLDVAPYDTNWLWICEKLNAQGAEIKLLITIREEDFRRTVVDYSKLSFSEIELMFGKDEASELFQLYSNHEFLTFADAWKSFGETGPLMEFTYMLNQSETLRARLSSQIKRIIQNENDADEWLRALTIISYAGRGNIRIDVAKLFSTINCFHQRKMLNTFEKEYFLRTINDGRYIEPLHALRATIIYEILKDESLFPELQVLTAALNSTDDNALMVVVSYIYENGITDEVVDQLASIKYGTWTLYASVLKSLLWTEVYTYFQKNKSVINEGDSLSNNSFPLLFLGDITGYYSSMDLSTFGDILEKQRPGIRKKIDDVLAKLNPRKIEYSYVDRFMQCTVDHFPVSQTLTEQELTSAGYSLFWLAKRGNYISEERFTFNFTKSEIPAWLEGYLNFLVGAQEQRWDSVYTSLYSFVKKQIQHKYNLILFDDSGSELFATSIINIFDEDGKQQFSNTYIMSIVEAVRRLCSTKEKYNVEIIGYNIIEGVSVPNMQKQIMVDKLPWVWITQLNGWLNKLHEYDLFPANWKICLQNINDVRKKITQIAKETIAGIDLLYRKRNTQKFIQKEHIALIQETLKYLNNSHAFSPQSEVDRFGIHSNNAIVQDMSNNFDMQKGGKEQIGFQKYFNKYCSSFSNYLDQRNELIINKIQGSEISNTARLSLINLIGALEELPKMQEAYKQEFALKNILFDLEEEYQQMLLLSGVWSYFYMNSFYIEKSIAYRQKEYIKNYRRKINSFFQSDIVQYDGVLSLQQNKRDIEMIVNAENVDIICVQMFEDMKRQFSEVTTLTLEGFLWEEYFDKIIIKISFLGDALPGGYVIPSKHFKTYDNLDKFLSCRTPSESDHANPQKTCKNALIKSFAYFQPLHMLARHFEQINEYLAEQDNTLIDDNIYCIWKDKVKNLICEWLDDIVSNLNYIFDSMDEITANQTKPKFQELLLQIQKFRDYLSTHISSISSKDVITASDSLNTSMAAFADQLPIELFL
jgi:hypothetical protein